MLVKLLPFVVMVKLITVHLSCTVDPATININKVIATEASTTQQHQAYYEPHHRHDDYLYYFEGPQ